MRIKKVLIRFLERYEWYYRFKYSGLVYTLIEAYRPKLKKSRLAEQQLFQSLLSEMPSASWIFDVGASVGNTTRIFQRLEAKVLAIEPAPENMRCLRARFGKNSNISLIEKALSNTVETQTLYLQESGNTLHTLNKKWKNYLEGAQNDRWQELVHFSKKIEIPTTTLSQLIEKHGEPYFIKIDVEGQELEVIQGLERAVPLLSFEANLPEFLTETLAAIDHLSTLSDVVLFNYTVSEKLVLEQFVSIDLIKAILRKTDLRYLDIVCRMK